MISNDLRTVTVNFTNQELLTLLAALASAKREAQVGTERVAAAGNKKEIAEIVELRNKLMEARK